MSDKTLLTPLDSEQREPKSGKTAQQIIVFLHGWGANGRDLMALAPFLEDDFPDARFLAPNAPFVCEANPTGFQWFSWPPQNASDYRESVASAQKKLTHYLQQACRAANLGMDKVFIIGFSQGTMMALDLLLSQTLTGFGGIVGFSGMVIPPPTSPPKEAHDITYPPVLLVHGEDDQVVPPQVLPEAEKTLQELGVPVEAYVLPGLAHSIDPQGLTLARDFLQRHINS